ncbi:MAG: 5-formyltetrahydrofolate cyclo-ligase [Actinomycetes bacterium]
MDGRDPEGRTSPDAASPEVARTKDALRRTALAARRALDDADRRRASAGAVARLLHLQEVRRARTVALYAALAEELDPVGALPALVERGVRTLFPRVRGERLELVAASDLLTLQLGYRGIREPVGPAIDPAVVDVVVVPGVAFDVHGGRLGQGGGHYDRLLATLPEGCVAIGVCFACQVVPRVPLEAHDLPVDVVVTEAGVHRRE